MAFKEIKSLDSDITIALGGVNKKTGKKNPTEIEGFYLGSRTVASKKSKSGTAQIHYFQTSKGDVGVWGKTDMDRKLGTATAGSMTRVSFDKMKPTPNGDMYTYKVEQDPDNSIEEDTIQTVSNTNSHDGDNNEDNTSDGSYTEHSEEDADEEDALQAAALAAAERKAKVQALLNKGKGANTKN